MRLDKYLKVSRIIKRRTVANEACDSGRVMLNDKVARASAEVKVGAPPPFPAARPSCPIARIVRATAPRGSTLCLRTTPSLPMASSTHRMPSARKMPKRCLSICKNRPINRLRQGIL